ncbi:MAG: hypothetical protein RLZZ502_825 [Pseudomonadota bacterium]|jgi:peptidoglycan/xylan/chitin deacetylase (PgdA/CDA1 family)
MKLTTYRPSALILGTVVLHVLSAIGLLLAPAWWKEVLLLLLLNHALLTVIGLWPRSQGLGKNINRLPASAGQVVAITIDDGPDPEVTPKVLALLAELRLKASFFVIGERVRAHPEIVRDIIAQGHEVHNHSDRHSHAFSCFMTKALRREITLGAAAIHSATGEHSQFFRAPAGLRNPLLDYVLQGLNMTLVSWTRRGFDTVTADRNKVLSALINDLRAGDILLVHDGHAATDDTGQAVILSILPGLAAALTKKQLSTVTLSACLT